MSRFLRTVAPVMIAIFLAPSLAVAGTAVVPVGTQITLAFTEVISPEVYQIGQSVSLVVENNVVIDGDIVFAAGAEAVGEVSTSQKKGGIGKPAKIGVTAITVEAVDGTKVAVSGTTYFEGENKQSSTLIITLLCCILGLLMKGGDAEIPAGATLDASVDMEVSITV